MPLHGQTGARVSVNPETRFKDLPADVREVVEDYLLTKSLTHAKLTVTVRDGHKHITDMNRTKYHTAPKST